MSHWLDSLLDITVIARDQKTLKSALSDLAERFEFSGYAYIDLRFGRTFAISNYHPEWQDHYFKSDLKSVDPVIRRAKKLRRTFSWSAEADMGSMSKSELAFFADATDFDIRSGITVPITLPNRGAAMLTFASRKPQLAVDHEVDAIMAASTVAQIHARIEALQATPSVEEPFYLSPKEVIFARWLELGKTVQDVADVEQVKYNTVRKTMEELRGRYDLCNNTQLVALAIRRGLI
ncbi:transcriptional regulator TraR [Rhizobium sp. AC44/96]|uniref:autoinducer-binding transcriptional regulator TraR n=1 Tax=unclassified Rhizobium TaxID=2613769 RepID=UPI00080FD785|nr:MULTISPECIES: transcriptional regulator TraR [unclassified Rhizobium]MDM9620455.1 transcriptional regulator TraR [Rhizobium sp. S96]OCJ09059.1 transcriptional regulator TraR [Rhizobium sp. AC44/96]